MLVRWSHRGMLAASAVMLVLGARPAAAQVTAPSVTDFFDDQVLHEIRLTINPRDWQDLKTYYQFNEYYPCHFTWQGVTVKNIAIRSRGVGSRSPVKPGLRVDFDYYEKDQTFLGTLKSVVLRNNTQDPSNLHERLSMQFFARLGVPVSREAHTKLYINNEYAGLYTLVESVDRVFLKDHFDENGGYLYKYTYEAEDLPYFFDDKGTDPALYTPKPFQPETHLRDPDPKPLVAMIRAINETPPVDFLGVMASYLDLTKFMVHVAIENFVADVDGVLGDYGMNNYYLYRFENQTLSTMIPWDKSEAFKGGLARAIWHNIDDVPPSFRNQLMERVKEFPELRDVYLDTLLKCAALARSLNPDAPDEPAGVGQPGWLEQEILREYEQVRLAALEDPVKPFSNEEFEQDIQLLLEFARMRSAFVENEVARYRR